MSICTHSPVVCRPLIQLPIWRLTTASKPLVLFLTYNEVSESSHRPHEASKFNIYALSFLIDRKSTSTDGSSFISNFSLWHKIVFQLSKAFLCFSLVFREKHLVFKARSRFELSHDRGYNHMAQWRHWASPRACTCHHMLNMATTQQPEGVPQDRRTKALEDYRKKLVEHRELDAKLKKCTCP